jgi:hypothetical protein
MNVWWMYVHLGLRYTMISNEKISNEKQRIGCLCWSSCGG